MALVVLQVPTIPSGAFPSARRAGERLADGRQSLVPASPARKQTLALGPDHSLSPSVPLSLSFSMYHLSLSVLSVSLFLPHYMAACASVARALPLRASFVAKCSAGFGGGPLRSQCAGVGASLCATVREETREEERRGLLCPPG